VATSSEPLNMMVSIFMLIFQSTIAWMAMSLAHTEGARTIAIVNQLSPKTFSIASEFHQYLTTNRIALKCLNIFDIKRSTVLEVKPNLKCTIQC